MEDKQLRKLNLKKHQIIRDNQNAKEYVLRRLINPIDVEINILIKAKIRALKSELWEREQTVLKNRTKVPKNQTRLEI